MAEQNFPPSARMFFCIGAQKAGTTWLYDALRQSRDVHFSRNKELHYFDVVAGKAQQVLDVRVTAARTLAGRIAARPGPDNRRNLAMLHAQTDLLSIYTGDVGNHYPYLQYLLQNYAGQQIVCDITPAYAIVDRATFADMGQIGDARFLFILRDPVARMWSQIRMAVKAAKTPTQEFSDACVARAKLLIRSGRLPNIERANYQRTITELEAAIPPDRIQYLFYERLFEPETMSEICEFLQIAPVTANGQTPSNKGVSAPLPDDLREQFKAAFAPQYAFIRRRFGTSVPDRWESFLYPETQISLAS